MVEAIFTDKKYYWFLTVLTIVYLVNSLAVAEFLPYFYPEPEDLTFYTKLPMDIIAVTILSIFGIDKLAQCFIVECKEFKGEILGFLLILFVFGVKFTLLLL